jgi:hypothetical protein
MLVSSTLSTSDPLPPTTSNDLHCKPPVLIAPAAPTTLADHWFGVGDSLRAIPGNPFMRIQLISCRLPIADSVLLRSSLFHHLCRFVTSLSGGLPSAREFLCRGLGSRWLTERFHSNALVTHFQHGQVFCTTRQLKDYAVTCCRFHQRTPQR